MSDPLPHLAFHGQLPPEAISQLAELLLSGDWHEYEHRCDRCDRLTDEYTTVFDLPDTGRTQLCDQCASQQEHDRC